MKTKYFVKKHGLLHIVYRVDSDYMGDHCTEDSRWEDKAKANRHARILNGTIKEDENKN